MTIEELIETRVGNYKARGYGSTYTALMRGKPRDRKMVFYNESHVDDIVIHLNGIQLSDAAWLLGVELCDGVPAWQLEAGPREDVL